MNRIAFQPHLYTSSASPRGTAYITKEDDRRQLTIASKEVYASLSKTQKQQLDTTKDKTIIFVDPYERQFKFSLKECGTWADMKKCIEKAMKQVRPEGVKYDYLVRDGEIILPESWECMVKPAMFVSLGVWPKEE